ncbi:MAG: hypothetical protein UT64_C0077G0008, partial [Candidatus Falkowbacteria bacterium GW2011_GWF2_39_8]
PDPLTHLYEQVFLISFVDDGKPFFVTVKTMFLFSENVGMELVVTELFTQVLDLRNDHFRKGAKACIF